MRAAERAPTCPYPLLHRLGAPVSLIISLSLLVKGKLSDWLGTGRIQSIGEEIPVELTAFGAL